MVIDIVGYTTSTGLADLVNRVIKLETDGVAGAQGPAGADGTDGAQGPRGPKGDKGEPGDATDLTALTARLDAAEAKIAASDIKIAALEAAQPFAVTNRDNDEDLTSVDAVVVAVTVVAPVAGQVTVNSTTTAVETTAGDDVRCSITTGTARDLDYLQSWESSGANGDVAQVAGTRTFNLAAGMTGTYNLVCTHFGTSGSSNVYDSVLTAIFTPAP